MSLVCAKQQNYVSRLLLISILTSIGFVGNAFASDDIISSIAQSSNLKAVEKCVAKINRNSDEALDAAGRLYQTSMCYLCVACDLDADNGRIFDGNHTLDFALSDSYSTAYRLMIQAADLGDERANYALAVIVYVDDLTKNKITKDQIASQRIEKISNQEKQLTDEELETSIKALQGEVYAKQQDQDFNSEIYQRLLEAGRQGHAPSQFALSQVFSRGIGMAPDKVKAYAWAATAVAQNPPFGSDRRDIHAEDMNTSELFDAESLADQYMKEYTNIFDRASVTVMR